MKWFVTLYLVFFASLIAVSQINPIKLYEDTHPQGLPGGPGVVINRKNLKNIIVSANGNQVYVTKDHGTTWEPRPMDSLYHMAGDPFLISTRKGTIYNFNLANPHQKLSEGWLDRIVCQESSDGGQSWKTSGYTGLNQQKNQMHPRVALHPRSGELYLTWTEFDQYKSNDAAHTSNVYFSQSGDGKKWSKPIRLNQTSGNSLGDDFTVTGAVPAVSYDGKLFAAWAHNNKIYLDRSFDKGNTWLTNDIPVTNQVGGWSMNIPGIAQGNGLPILLMDNSPTRLLGSLYLIWADQKNGEDDTDIWFMRSANFGDNWSSPLRINNDDPGKHQFLPWATIDQSTGFIYIIYYDRRAYEDIQTDVYLAYSTNGGNSFNNIKISNKPFIPATESFMSDHTHIDAHGGVIVPVWTQVENEMSSVWTAIIKHEDLDKIK